MNANRRLYNLPIVVRCNLLIIIVLLTVSSSVGFYLRASMTIKNSTSYTNVVNAMQTSGKFALRALWRPYHNQLAVTYSESTNIDIVDVSTKTVQGTLVTPSLVAPALGVSDVAWSLDGTLLASSFEDNVVNVWDLRNAVPIYSRTIFNKGRVPSLSWNPDGRKLAVTWGYDDDRSVLIWDVADGSLLTSIEDELRAFKWGIWSPNEQLFATATWDGMYKLWDGRFYNLLISIPEVAGAEQSSTRLATWSPDSHHLAGVNCIHTSGSCTIWMYDVDNKTLSEPLQYDYESSLRAAQLSWSPDGKYLGASDESRQVVYIWDVFTKTLVSTLSDFSNPVTSISWSSDSQHLALADGTLHIWNISTKN